MLYEKADRGQGTRPMALNFPRQDEIRLQHPPLAEVICQIRFPPILRIGQEQPAELQELVRGEFPNLEVDQGMLLRVPVTGGAPSAERAPTTYRFLTADRGTLISLAQDFYSLSTTSYQHWESFVRYLAMANESVSRVYEPAHATRVGLRYINRLTAENTQSETVAEMLQKLRPELTTLLLTDTWADPKEMRMRLLLPSDEAQLTLQTRFGEEEGVAFFGLDFDFFEEGEIPLDSIVERCTQYQQLIYDAFRWSVPDDTLQAFGVRTE